MKTIKTNTKFEFSMEDSTAIEKTYFLLNSIYEDMKDGDDFLGAYRCEIDDMVDFFKCFVDALNCNEGIVELH